MSFLSDFWSFLNRPADEAIEKIYRAQPQHWIAQFVPADRISPKLDISPSAPIIFDRDYVTVIAKKAELTYSRVAFKKFYGVVHSTIMMHDGGGEPRSTTVFHTLDAELVKMDSGAAGNAIMGPRVLMDQTPYRGTAMGASIALLALEAVDYAVPLVATLQKMSDLAGVKFFAAAKALAEPLIGGIQALAAVAQGSATQVVYAGDLPARTGIFLIAGIPKEQFDWNSYSVDVDHTLLKNGKPVGGIAYIVLSIDSAQTRQNWREIPEIDAAQAELNAVLKSAGSNVTDRTSSEFKKAEDALARLVRACVYSEELCDIDAQSIADQCTEKFKSYIARLGSVTTSRMEPKTVMVTRPLDEEWDAFSLEGIEPTRV